MLQIAHQFVPRYSEVLVKTTVPQVMGEMLADVETETIQTMPWDMARQALVQGATLLKLGVDAIVGDDLAQYWQTLEDTPIEEIRLSTKVAVVPGSTRSITDQRLAEDMTRLYNEALWPSLYQPLGRFDLAAKYLTHIGQLKGWQNMEDLVPDDESIQQFLQQQQEQMQAQQQMEAQQQEGQMQAQQAELENKQTANEMELQHQAVKNEMEIDRETQKMASQKEAMRNKKRADV
jgi:hypothetical protein